MARKNKGKRVRTVGRIAPSLIIRNRSYKELAEIAARLAPIRTEVWRRYGSRAALGRSHEDIRDQDWMGEDGFASSIDLPARVWKATVDDVLGDIKANREAAKQSVIENLYRRDLEESDRDEKVALLRHNEWFGDNLLRRLMRIKWRRGKTSVDNHIVLDCQSYTIEKRPDGKTWLEVTSLTPRERISIPLKGNPPISGTIRLILRGDNHLDVHYAMPEIEACVTRPCGLRVVAADKGYTEVFTDSDGDRHGEKLGKMLTTMTDKNNIRYIGRQTLSAIADKHLATGHYRKYERIVANNLGKQKLVRQKKVHRAKVRTEVFTATHAVIDKASVFVVEDLSKPINRYDRYKKKNRRLSGWVKGIIQEAVVSVSRRRGASVDCVNAAYTSQVVRCHPSFGTRDNGKLHCTKCRAVYDVDAVAAENILERRSDTEIGRYTNYKKVRAILEERFRTVSPSDTTAETARPGLQLGFETTRRRQRRAKK